MREQPTAVHAENDLEKMVEHAVNGLRWQVEKIAMYHIYREQLIRYIRETAQRLLHGEELDPVHVAVLKTETWNQGIPEKYSETHFSRDISRSNVGAFLKDMTQLLRAVREDERGIDADKTFLILVDDSIMDVPAYRDLEQRDVLLRSGTMMDEDMIRKEFFGDAPQDVA